MDEFLLEICITQQLFVTAEFNILNFYILNFLPHWSIIRTITDHYFVTAGDARISEFNLSSVCEV